MTERVLCIVAHPDDESLGCGATLAKHVAAGDVVSIVAMADGVKSRTTGLLGMADAIKERHGMMRAACKILGTEDVWLHQFPDNQMDGVTLLAITKQIELHVNRLNPTVVYTHNATDLNIDHRQVHDAVNVACRPQPGSGLKRVLYFECPCSTAWGQGFTPNWFEEVAPFMDQKISALECYADELRHWPHPRSIPHILNMLGVRGAQVGVTAAEGFILGRQIA